MARPKNDPNALGAFAGFSAQPIRMALLLLTAGKGALVSLELFEDVGVSSPDGTVLASQMKVGKNNPVTNKAESLWKTFANWVRSVREGKIDPTLTTFEMHVEGAFTGSLVSRFHDVGTSSAACAAAEEACDVLWGKGAARPLRSKVAVALQPHLDYLFGSKASMKAFAAVILRFRFTAAGKPAIDELRRHLSDTMLVQEAVLPQVMHYYLGWVDAEIQKQIKASGRPPVIARDTAVRTFRTYHDSLVAGNKLPDSGDEPTAADLSKLSNAHFLRQLDLIEADKDTRIYAMTCFFRAASARTRWVDNELVREESMRALYSNLAQAFRDIRNSEFRPDLTAAQQGRVLLGKCHRHTCPVEQKDPPPYFIPGSFHALADRGEIGWHPDYEKLLRGVA